MTYGTSPSERFAFTPGTQLSGKLGRSGVISTPHGEIQTPAFIPVGTKATVKGVLPESMKGLEAQALLSNAYHLYLQPGPAIVDEAGGLGPFMNWAGPTFTDSGGFQVLSLGVGFKTLHNTRSYQERSLERTRLWAKRCLVEHGRLTQERSHRPYQALFGVLQGAQYEDLRRKGARDLSGLDEDGITFDGFGLGGALDKENLGTIVSWMCEELPRDKPRHLLGIGEPDDLFIGVENGADTFDCVAPSRQARTSAVFTKDGRVNLSNTKYQRQFAPIDADCDCYTCTNYSAAYVAHLFRSKEMVAGTLATIHNERFIVRLVNQMRTTIETGDFFEFKREFLGRFYVGNPKRQAT